MADSSASSRDEARARRREAVLEDLAWAREVRRRIRPRSARLARQRALLLASRLRRP
jgi:hypothetical protein